MRAGFWTHEHLRVAFERSLEHYTMEDLAAELTVMWNHPVTASAVRGALKKGFPENNFRATMGKNRRLRELAERREQSQRMVTQLREEVSSLGEEESSRRVDYQSFGKADLQRKHAIPADRRERGDLVFPLNENSPTLVMVWPDAHVPHHDPATMEACLLLAEALRPDLVVDLGDFLDLDQISRHGRDGVGGTSLRESVVLGRHLLAEQARRLDAVGVRKRVFIAGNHEHRLHRFILERAPELYEIVPTVQEALGLAESGWEFVSYGGYLRIGPVGITHGEKFTKHIADTMVTSEGTTVIGHVHRIQLAVKNTRPGHPEVSMTPGTRAKTSQPYEYHRPNDHVHGCGIVQIMPDYSVTMIPVMAHTGVIRWPMVGGTTLVCDGNKRRSYEELRN